MAVGPAADDALEKPRFSVTQRLLSINTQHDPHSRPTRRRATITSHRKILSIWWKLIFHSGHSEAFDQTTKSQFTNVEILFPFAGTPRDRRQWRRFDLEVQGQDRTGKAIS